MPTITVMQNNKKILIMSIVIVLVILVTLIFFFGRRTMETGKSTFLGKLFPESKPATQVISPPLKEGAGKGIGGVEIEEPSLNKEAAKNLPTGSLIRLSKGVVSSLAVTGSTTRYHKNIAENPGHLFERQADGSNEEKRTSNFTIPQILKVVWSTNAKKAVIFYNLNQEVRRILVDYTDTTPKTNFLPNTISAVAFSPDSKSMVFINDLGDTRNIFIANSNFGNQKKILDNNVPHLEISWPAPNLVAVKTKSSYAIPGFLYTMNSSGGNFTKIVESLGLDAVWNKNGDKIVYTNSDLDLFYLDIKTGVNKNLGLKTVAEKCTFSNLPTSGKNNIVYCAIPKVINDANYPDEWWQGKIVFSDNIIAIDINTLDLVLFAETSSDVVNPTVLNNDTYFLFKNRNTGELWSLKLK